MSAALVWKASSASIWISPIVPSHRRLGEGQMHRERRLYGRRLRAIHRITGQLRIAVLAAYRGDQLVHVGNVGTGFKEAEMTRLRKMLDRVRWKRKQPSVPYPGKADIVWVEPTLIAEIEFRAWTGDGKLLIRACGNGRTMPTFTASPSNAGGTQPSNCIRSQRR